MIAPFPRAAAVLAAAALSASCAGGTVQSAAPAQPAPAVGADAPRVRLSEADVRFLQGMVPHHAQALAMTALVPERTRNEAIRLLAERIEVSQQDEIAAMQRLLRGHETPSAAAGGAHAHHGAGEHARMPGMLTPEQLARLAAASGPEFDRLFLEFMIQHHEGALVMVDQLFATPGGGQESEIYAFASEVEADQGMEIQRMRRMLQTLP